MEDLVLPAESESVAEGKTRQLRDGRWSVQCKWCEEKKTEQADDDSAFNEMLKKCNWRLTNPRKRYINRNWTCPECAQVFKDSDATPTATDTTPKTTDAAGSAGQLAAHAAAPSSDGLYSEVEQLEAVLKELKVLVEGHVQVKQAHVDKLRKLRRKMVDLKAEVLAEVTAAQHQPPVSPPGIPPTSDPPEPTDS